MEGVDKNEGDQVAVGLGRKGGVGDVYQYGVEREGEVGKYKPKNCLGAHVCDVMTPRPPHSRSSHM